MVQASNIWPRNQVICMNDERLRRELGDDTTKQISSNFTTDNGQGPMKVFIINQPVRNVIRAGNNLIVETEPSNKINPPDFQQLTTTPHMDKNDEKELEIENISKILKSDQGVHDNRMDRMDHQMDPFETTSTDYQNNEVKPNIGKGKTKKKPVPPNQKDDVYWERRRKNNLAAKRSRESRRNRDNQTTLRTSFLEAENMELRDQINQVRSELLDVKEKLQEYNVIYRGTAVQKMAEAVSSLPTNL